MSTIATQLNSNISVAYTPICGGTTASGPIQSVASLGASGTVLTSNGAGILPSFQAVSGALTTTSVSLSVSQITGANSTPVTLVAAQGANTVICVTGIIFVMVVAGTAYALASNSLVFGYGASASNIENTCITAPITNAPFNGVTNSTVIMYSAPMTCSVSGQTTNPIVGRGISANSAVNFSSTSAVTGGTGSGNSTVYITYYVVTV
ncbi:hypothetical protein UFOVP270_23 [uncultured Caudovirales phage]|uniref:Uncharacterized protein n=1 Tax=uncultured Caudovirales phage TaxID=2100421 RepID=A0A6J5L3Q4_9CAUD|nr:hypothetical protein UFOVP101_33 [uncultured Caudovirales phage]CAB4134153.1 hypothetical protein UFOVP270_23 [uncultured Caudovirales phage]